MLSNVNVMLIIFMVLHKSDVALLLGVVITVSLLTKYLKIIINYNEIFTSILDQTGAQYTQPNSPELCNQEY